MQIPSPRRNNHVPGITLGSSEGRSCKVRVFGALFMAVSAGIFFTQASKDEIVHLKKPLLARYIPMYSLLWAVSVRAISPWPAPSSSPGTGPSPSRPATGRSFACKLCKTGRSLMSLIARYERFFPASLLGLLLLSIFSTLYSLVWIMAFQVVLATRNNVLQSELSKDQGREKIQCNCTSLNV